ncbi:hypothetical protein B0H34DRAFT_23363 [Crassisporium funariophilum]|nr:hypothetical protein B0H34DRAFT_23363 [Crassisporium funariophilum]
MPINHIISPGPKRKHHKLLASPTSDHSTYFPNMHSPGNTQQSTTHRDHTSRHSSPVNNHTLARRSRRAHHHDYDLHAGAEPGVNPRSGTSIAEFSHFKQQCQIDVVDYDCDDASFERMSNADLILMLQKEELGIGIGPDDDLPPRRVRWVNIGGIDWDVLSAVALKYNFHSLALEDILHERGHNHSKADYYPGHLFLRVLCHSLQLDEISSAISATASNTSLDLLRQPSSLGATSEFPADFSGMQTPLNLEQGMSKVNSSYGAVNRIDSTTTTNGVGNTTKLKPDFGIPDFSSALKKRLTRLSGFKGPAREKQLLEIQALTRGSRVNIKHEPMFIFLMHDGTVISIHPTPNLDFTAPIKERLHKPDSVLRTSEDPSLLVESLLDLIVDRVLEMVDEYQVKINKLERDILLHPGMVSVRNLHIISGDLILHKRTLDPIKTMIYNLRHHDLDRCMALADHMAMDPDYASDNSEKSNSSERSFGTRHDSNSTMGREIKPKQTVKKVESKRQRQRERARVRRATLNVEDSTKAGQSNEASAQAKNDLLQRRALEDMHRRQMRRDTRSLKVEGFFSYQSKVYLADVYDHMDFALTSLDMFSGNTENLINYAFNTASYEMNKVMSRLTMATIIFLPLTLLTGYFGMNFDPFWAVDKNSDLFFWKVAIPVMATLIPVFMFADIREGFRYMRRDVTARQAVKYFGHAWLIRSLGSGLNLWICCSRYCDYSMLFL